MLATLVPSMGEEGKDFDSARPRCWPRHGRRGHGFGESTSLALLVMSSETGPHHFAVIFSSTLVGESAEYSQAADRMEELAADIDGFLGVESYRAGLRGVSISYWRDEEAIRVWREHPEHIEARARGKADWYQRFRLQVARVEREYGFERKTTGGT